MRFGPLEIGLILVIILIVFGAGKLPQVGSAIGKTIRSFKKAQTEDDVDPEEKRNVAAAKSGDKGEKSA
jgi:sec-independent protein translocase protein TatA